MGVTMKEKLYLVTGAAGHLGRVVAKQLVESGKIVRVLVLSEEKHIPEKVDVYFGDVRDMESMKPFFQNSNGYELVVIHCAGIVSIATKYNQLTYDVNVTGTRNIIELCKEFNVLKLVYVSSVHAIPEKPDNLLMTEIDEFNPDNVVGAYAKTKAQATSCVLNAAKQGLNACVVHPSGITGPYDYGRGHLTTLVIDYYERRLIFGINGGYDFVDVRDVANGIISACDKGRKGQCYILSNKYFAIKEILNMLYEITGKNKINNFLPFWFIKVTAPLAETYYKILRQPPLFTPYSIYTLNSNSFFSHDKATHELGYTTRDMKETLTDTVNWLKEMGRI